MFAGFMGERRGWGGGGAAPETSSFANMASRPGLRDVRRRQAMGGAEIWGLAPAPPALSIAKRGEARCTTPRYHFTKRRLTHPLFAGQTRTSVSGAYLGTPRVRVARASSVPLPLSLTGVSQRSTTRCLTKLFLPLPPLALWAIPTGKRAGGAWGCGLLAHRGGGVGGVGGDRCIVTHVPPFRLPAAAPRNPQCVVWWGLLGRTRPRLCEVLGVSACLRFSTSHRLQGALGLNRQISGVHS